MNKVEATTSVKNAVLSLRPAENGLMIFPDNKALHPTVEEIYVFNTIDELAMFLKTHWLPNLK